jgi:hypothetical protein
MFSVISQLISGRDPVARVEITRWLVALTAGGVLLLSGCSSSGGINVNGQATVSDSGTPAAPDPTELTTPTPTPTPTTEKNTTYSSVVELKDAAVEAGYPCDNWTEDDQVTNASESGNCNDWDVFAIYASDSGRDQQIAQTRANNELLKDSGVEPGVVLFGPNWSINVSDDGLTYLPDLKAALGGIEAK